MASVVRITLSGPCSGLLPFVDMRAINISHFSCNLQKAVVYWHICNELRVYFFY